MFQQNATFIVQFWEVIFRFLSKLSVFFVVRKVVNRFLSKHQQHIFVEGWALGHLFLSILAIPGVLYIPYAWVGWAISLYGLVRVFEVVVYQVNVLLFDQFRQPNRSQPYEVLSYRRLIILLIQNYFEIIFWFAAQYVFFGQLFSFLVEGTADSVLGAVYTSFVVMTSFGVENISPSGVLAYTIVIAQAMIGLFMTLLSLARFIGLLPAPGTMTKEEQS